MLSDITAQSFDILWEVENRPVADILIHQVSNNPVGISDPAQLNPYNTLQHDVPCIFAGGPSEGQTDDDTTRYDLSLFFREEDLEYPPSLKWLFKYEKRLYKLTDQDPNFIFGLVEFHLMRAD